MVNLPGHAFWMGTDAADGFPDDGEGPIHKVRLSPFSIDTCAVTNEAFAAFVSATGYVTDAERYGWSFVFHLLLPKYASPTRGIACAPWWRQVEGAFWNHPEGPQSSIDDRLDHPVVHVSWNDAAAFARWAGKRLPTEAEWEYAARGGTPGTRYPWGDDLEPRGRHKINVFQGKFPDHNTAADGFAGTCPVTAFEPNAFGLHNMLGNVWEWTADWFSATWHVEASDRTRRDPIGPVPHDEPDRAGSPGVDGDASQPHGGFTHKAQKGGSYLCHHSYCNRYRLGARTANTPDSATTNNGFRCVRDA
jgi:formylglycine-generating enzyme